MSVVSVRYIYPSYLHLDMPGWRYVLYGVVCKNEIYIQKTVTSLLKVSLSVLFVMITYTRGLVLVSIMR